MSERSALVSLHGMRVGSLTGGTRDEVTFSYDAVRWL